MHPIVEQKIAAGHCICGRGLSVDPRCPIHKHQATEAERRRYGMVPMDPQRQRELDDARDARRYRWLRERTVATGLAPFVAKCETQFLDEAVDACMTAGVSGVSPSPDHTFSQETPVNSRSTTE